MVNTHLVVGGNWTIQKAKVFSAVFVFLYQFVKAVVGVPKIQHRFFHFYKVGHSLFFFHFFPFLLLCILSVFCRAKFENGLQIFAKFLFVFRRQKFFFSIVSILHKKRKCFLQKHIFAFCHQIWLFCVLQGQKNSKNRFEKKRF